MDKPAFESAIQGLRLAIEDMIKTGEPQDLKLNDCLDKVKASLEVEENFNPIASYGDYSESHKLTSETSFFYFIDGFVHAFRDMINRSELDKARQSFEKFSTRLQEDELGPFKIK